LFATMANYIDGFFSRIEKAKHLAFTVGEWPEFGCCLADDLVDKETLRMALGFKH
jgi:hypothetical protein